jgi:NADPH:quinone reductase-like Zn-dependent oxidoreductase
MSIETPQTMKAIHIHTFGGPEVLAYEDVARPVAGPGEVLIRVFAAGLYPGDWYIRSGFANVPEPVRRFLQSWPISLPFIPGSQASGIVEAVGPGVTAFHKGDAVYGLLRFPGSGSPAGAYAEYVTAPAEHLALKPASIDHLQAAAVPMAALTVWQGIMEHTNLQAGQTVLVNGAAGGTGHIECNWRRSEGRGSSASHPGVMKRFCAHWVLMRSLITRPHPWSKWPMRSMSPSIPSAQWGKIRCS